MVSVAGNIGNRLFVLLEDSPSTGSFFLSYVDLTDFSTWTVKSTAIKTGITLDPYVYGFRNFILYQETDTDANAFKFFSTEMTNYRNGGSDNEIGPLIKINDDTGLSFTSQNGATSYFKIQCVTSKFTGDSYYNSAAIDADSPSYQTIDGYIIDSKYYHILTSSGYRRIRNGN